MQNNINKYFYKILTKLKKQTHIIKLLILTLIIWNVIITILLTIQPTKLQANIPQFTEYENQVITAIEEI